MAQMKNLYLALVSIKCKNAVQKTSHKFKLKMTLSLNDSDLYFLLFSRIRPIWS